MTVFADFCRMAACCLAAGSREKEYLETVKPYSREELNEFARALALLIGEMESQPFTDVLGTYYLEIAAHGSKQARGEFYTPPEISRLIGRMILDPDDVMARGRPVTVYEPACGSGGMLLALAQPLAPDSVDLLRVTARDINPVATDMCYINLTLWGIPARILLGNSLGAETPREWKNIHWFRVGEELRLTVEAFRDLMAGTGDSPEREPPAAVDLGEARKSLTDSRGQGLLDL